MPTGNNGEPTPDLVAPEKSQAINDREQQRLATLEAERQAIEDGARLAEILKDPLVANAVAQLGRHYYNLFLKAASRAEREDAWARGRALNDLAKELVLTVNHGKGAKLARQQRQSRERTAERQKRR